MRRPWTSTSSAGSGHPARSCCSTTSCACAGARRSPMRSRRSTRTCATASTCSCTRPRGREMGWYRSPGFRGLAIAASDGIIGTAGVLQGFAGAGASSSTLLVASISALVAGSAAGFGSKYAELAADRDAERAVIADEERDLHEDSSDELAELTAHFEERGVERDLARATAEQMFAHDALAAQLETEHGITARTGAAGPYLGALATAL